MRDSKDIGKKLEDAAFTLLECAERWSSAAATPGQEQSIPGVVDAALKLLDNSRAYS